ncbi:hypothetical protein EJV47_04390 [Hymenobacter gummosus]|uniref:Uncharacterized protein n=1 Tax=Hymenobacter gummosus TaxID=1776032 RepID=A0A3S0JGA7_9BACT|nr:hypothetical protein [Hymenobacter gummosus]RTQ52270.1 hypothetical protein EJV47_04390 [Hymenobacter gummosus]
MKFLGFSLGGQNIDLEWPGGGYADLHNNFNFTALHFEPSQARLRLSWRKSAGEWAKREPWAELHLLFEGVSFLRIKERDPEYPLTEDGCLVNICLTPQNVRDEFENIYFDEDAEPDYDLTLYFQSEWA